MHVRSFTINHPVLTVHADIRKGRLYIYCAAALLGIAVALVYMVLVCLVFFPVR